jgi:hypothetical protein
MPDRHDLAGLPGPEPGTSYQGKDSPSSQAPTSPRLVAAVSPMAGCVMSLLSLPLSGDHLLRRLRQVVQDRPGAAAFWADIPGLSFHVDS